MFSLFLAYLISLQAAFAQGHDIITMQITNNTGYGYLLAFTPSISMDGRELKTCAPRDDIPGVIFKGQTFEPSVTVTTDLPYAAWYVGLYQDHVLVPNSCVPAVADRNTTFQYTYQELVAPPLQLTVQITNPPSGSKVVVWDGAVCPENFTQAPVNAYDFATTTWPVPVVVDGFISVGLYAKQGGDELKLVPNTCQPNIAKQPAYTVKLDLPAPIVAAPPVVKRPAKEPVSTAYLGTMIYPGWDLTPLGGFMVEPRSIPFETRGGWYWVNSTIQLNFSKATTGETGQSWIATPDANLGLMVGRDIYQGPLFNSELTVSAQAGLDVGLGPAQWDCLSNAVADGSSLQLNCSATKNTSGIKLVTLSPSFGPSFLVSADVPIKQIRVGFSVSTQLRWIKPSLLLPDLSEQATNVIGSDGQMYWAHYTISGGGFIVPVVPMVRLVWVQD